MSFDVTLPFVRSVYKLIRQGHLDKCAALLSDLLSQRPKTRLHCVLDQNFDCFLPDYSDWLISGCNGRQLDGTVAICTSMGEFEINYRDWTAGATINPGFDMPANPYEWLAESDGRLIGEWFHFTGMDSLTDAFAYADEFEQWDRTTKSPYEPDVFTAACYLVFVNFSRLNRLAHQLAHSQGHGLAQAHLFCNYGDCLFHSPPFAPAQGIDGAE